MLITFSGLDGSGKSTLISWLTAELERRDRRVTVLHMNDHVGVYACLRAIRDRVRRPNPLIAARRNKVAPPPPPGLRGRLQRARDALVWNKGLRRALYLIDLSIFLCYRLYVEKLRNRILIMDRYFYDTLVDVTNGDPTVAMHLLYRLTPTPDVPVFLDISPEQSFERKGEYTVDYLRNRHSAYCLVFPWVTSAVRLRNDDLAATQRALVSSILPRLAS